MKAIRAAAVILASIVGLSINTSARAEGRFFFPVGVSYASGIHDATDKLFDAYERDGFDVTKIDVPIGLVLNPYYEWQTSIGGIAVGLSVGPTSFVFVEEKTWTYNGYYGFHNSEDETKFSYAVPVGAFVRYTPWPQATVSPYVRAGFKYPFAGGDNFGSSQIGASGAVGVEFWRTKKVGMSVEVGYDSSEIKVEYSPRNPTASAYSEKVTFPGFTAALSVVF